MSPNEVRAWLRKNDREGREPATCMQLADLCGVGRAHLSLVLSRQRTSKPLLEKITKLHTAQRKEIRAEREAQKARNTPIHG